MTNFAIFNSTLDDGCERNRAETKRIAESQREEAANGGDHSGGGADCDCVLWKGY